MGIAYVGFGTNMGDRAENIKEAVSSINLLPETKVTKISKIYETEPWGFKDQKMFLNGALKVETELSPNAFLGALLGIEAGMGRVRTIKNGPRIIDLDLLFYDDLVLNSKELVLPHPRIFERAFVLKPLGDICNSEEILTALENIDKSGVTEYKF